MMISRIPELIRASRRNAGLTQAQLAERLGTSQSAVARLERPGSNPTVDMLERALIASGHRLEIGAAPSLPPVDEGQIVSHLRLSPAQRLEKFSASHRNMGELVRRARPVRGDLV
jgi:transcriptional regulator with XRE-family HTH domain